MLDRVIRIAVIAIAVMTAVLFMGMVKNNVTTEPATEKAWDFTPIGSQIEED